MSYAPVVSFDLNSAECLWLDFSASNPDLKGLNPDNTEDFTAYVFKKLENAGARVGIGGWLEKRMIYDSRQQFNAGSARNIHLGADIWAAAGTPLFSPVNAKIHSFANNEGFGNYGPTIILESTEEPLFFLFGHLSLESLNGLEKGQTVYAGQKIAEIGNYPVNGDWPPHLHFQVMNTMHGMEGDFPGVCSEKQLKVMTGICQNPYPFLGIEK